jgi:hypothetical protein
MKRASLLLCLLTSCGVSLGCDARGVNVGTEELCVLDARLAEALLGSSERLGTCAAIGQNRLADGGFESPPIGSCQNGLFCQFSAATVNSWQTTSGPQLIEIWHDGHRGVPAPEGSQFVELDATSADTLFEDLALPPGQLMFWSLQHRGRNGDESMEVRIGPVAATLSQGVLTSGVDDWHAYSGLYRVGANETLTSFELASLFAGSEGNLVDDVLFAPVSEP